MKNLFVQKAEYIRAVDDISFSIEKGDIVMTITGRAQFNELVDSVSIIL